ncbi:hypothetical protein BLNAU_18368 [Blattamonas nauphoetae]|uniref:Protein kinase domain-containing protein n=1 Tax=Blattamonas nauphoetae TaxID=2049346 RepID=A0ABQ9X4J4_9EUKA|nr:hypothetical protein BLNAU_18368 [Blattamonas nauphoetae]
MILLATCELGEGIEHAKLTLEGWQIPQGTYTVTIKEVDGFSLPVTFSSSGNVTSEPSPFLLFGKDHVLEPETTYTLSTVVNSDSDLITLDPWTIRFTTPRLSGRIESIKPISFTNEKKKVIKVTLEGFELIAGGGSVVVKISETENRTFTPTFTGTEEGAFEVVVFAHDDREPELIFGTTYTIVAVTDMNGAILLRPKDFTFQVPNEPLRLVSASTIDATVENITSVRFLGRAFTEKANIGLTLKGTPPTGSSLTSHTPTVTISASSDTEASLELTLYPFDLNDVNQLRFGFSYSVTAMDGNGVVEPTAVFTIPVEPARIVAVKNTLDSTGNYTEIVIVGRMMEPGTYTVELNDSSSTTFEVVFGTSDENEKIQRDSQAGKVEVFGTEARLVFGQKYQIVSVNRKDSNADAILIDGRFDTFTIPDEPTRLMEFVIDGYDESQKKVNFVMTGRVLDEEATYKVELTASPEVNHTIEMTYKSSGKWEGSATLYPSTEPELVYGTTYTVSSFRKGAETDELLRNALAAIKIMDEPARLVSTSKVNVGENGTTVTLTSRALSASSQYLIKVVGEPTTPSESNEEHSTTLKMKPSSATSNTLSVSLYPDAELKYGYTYSVEEMKITGALSSILIEKLDCVFSTPIEPTRLVEFNVSGYDIVMKKVDFVMTGRVLEEGATYEIGLSVSSTLKHTIEMKYNTTSDKWEGSATLYPSTSAELVYGETYTVSSFRKAATSTELLREELDDITIDDEPARLVSTSTVNGDNATTLTLTSRSLSTVKEYSMKVVGEPTVPSGSNEAHTTTIIFTPSSATSNTLSLSLYSFPGELLYGHTYSVEEMKITGASSSILIEKLDCVFSTPTEPTRLVKFTEGGYDDEKKTIGFVMTGRVLDEEATYKVELSASATENHTIEMKYNTTSDEWEGSAVLYPSSDAELVYGTTYTVSSFRKGTDLTELLRDAQTPIKIMDEPARLVSTSYVVISRKNGIELTLTSRSLSTGSQYSMKVVGTPTTPSESNEEHTPTITFSASSTTENKMTLTLYPLQDANLKYGHSYSVDWMNRTNDSSSVLIEKLNCVFSTPEEPPHLNTLETNIQYSEKDTKGTVVLSGVKMTNGPFTVSLSVNGSNAFPASFQATFKSNGENGEATFTLFPTASSDLKYDTTYSVIGVKDKSLNDVLFNSDLSFTTMKEPARLTSVGESADVTLENLKQKLTFPLVGIKLDNGPYTLVFASDDGKKTGKAMGTMSDGVSGKGESVVFSLTPTDIELGWNTKYDLQEVLDKDQKSVHFVDGLTVTTPAEPKRILSFSSLLDPTCTIAHVVVVGHALSNSPITLKFVEDTDSLTITPTLSSSDSVTKWTFDLALSDWTLSLGKAIALETANGTEVVVHPTATLKIPKPPRLTKVKPDLKGIGTLVSLSLEGVDLPIDRQFNLRLEGVTDPIPVVFSSATEGHTKLDVPIGWPGFPQFSGSHKILSLSVDETLETVLLDLAKVDFPAKLDSIEVFVNESSNTDHLFCGTKSKPCSSFETGWEIVSTLEFSEASILTVSKVTLSRPIAIVDGMSVLISNGSNTKPTITIPSSSTLDSDSTLIVMTSATVQLENVNFEILVESEDFRLVSSSSSTTLKINMCHFTGTSSSLSQSQNDANLTQSSLDVCSWSTGLFCLVDTDTEIDNSRFSQLIQGALNVRGGIADIDTSTFNDNYAGHVLFHSMRHNLHCSDEGKVVIGSLSGGDGSSEHPSAWMAMNNCSMSGSDSHSEAPFFIPTLDKTSKTNFLKKTKTFEISIVGTTLIPCGLSLEVFELDKQNEGNHTAFPLSIDFAITFTETSIELSIPQSFFSPLQEALEWKGRLVYGQNQKTQTSFLIQANSAERRAQMVKENMKWWLPLVIALALLLLFFFILVFVLWRRRHNKQKQTQLKESQSRELDQDLEIVEKYEPIDSLGPDLVASTNRPLNKDGVGAVEPSDVDPTMKTNIEIGGQLFWTDAMACDDKCQIVNAVQGITLFERLHGKDQPSMKISEIGGSIVKGVTQLVKSHPTSDALKQLNPHQIVLDRVNHVFFLLNFQNDATLSGNVTSPEKTRNDGKRWQAPEQAHTEVGTAASQKDSEAQKPLNLEKMSVFRLGLILLEIETGSVPFAEQDAVNASRQLCSGILPPMERVSEDVREVIEKCLSIDPTKRPTLSELEEFIVSLSKPVVKQTSPHSHIPLGNDKTVVFSY